MPQVDLSSVCGGAAIAPDQEAAVETTTTTTADEESDDQPPPAPALDYAPESFCLSKDAELEWLDQNAFIERKNSGKASDPNPIHGSSSSNRGHSTTKIKPKASFFGLPKPRKPNYAEAMNRKPGNIHLFPNQSGPVGRKPGPALSEPSSPKVSCMGRVRSRKDRRKKTEPDFTVKEKKAGFWGNFKAIFRSKGGKTGCKGTGPDGEPVVPVPKKKCGGEFVSVPGEPPGLGAVTRFTSGRRSDAWASEIEMNGPKCEPSDQSPIWRRREKGGGGPPPDVDVDRDWMSVGPATV